MNNKILFRHNDGSIYLSIEQKLIVLYPTSPRYQLSYLLKKLPKSQRYLLEKLYHLPEKALTIEE